MTFNFLVWWWKKRKLSPLLSFVITFVWCHKEKMFIKHIEIYLRNYVKFHVNWIWSLMCFTATSPGRTRSPLRTSLRSLQAVRNSRSLETEDYQPVASQTTSPLSGLDLFFFWLYDASVQAVWFFWQCYIRFKLLRHTNNWTQHTCTFCRIHELRRPAAQWPDDRSEETEVSVCQPLQDPSPCKGSPVCSWTCFCLSREVDHRSLGQKCAIYSKVKAVTSDSLTALWWRINTWIKVCHTLFY